MAKESKSMSLGGLGLTLRDAGRPGGTNHTNPDGFLNGCEGVSRARRGISLRGVEFSAAVALQSGFWREHPHRPDCAWPSAGGRTREGLPREIEVLARRCARRQLLVALPAAALGGSARTTANSTTFADSTGEDAERAGHHERRRLERRRRDDHVQDQHQQPARRSRPT